MNNHPFANKPHKNSEESGMMNIPHSDIESMLSEVIKGPFLSENNSKPVNTNIGKNKKDVVQNTKSFILPKEIEGYVEIEDCSDFNINRYYETDDIRKLYENIINMQTLSEEMHELKIDYLNTTLLYGLPGTGKTAFCKYLAYKLDLPFAYINFAKIMGGGFGETSKHISDVFRFMAQERCVFMLDEIDCVTARRSANTDGTNGELNRITITVMQELDYYKSHRVNSIILAATNRKDTLDEALLSRFAIKHDMKFLTNDEKREYLKKYLNDVGIPYDEKQIIQYCADNFLLEQRNMESDMIQSIADWIVKGRKGFVTITHIS